MHNETETRILVTGAGSAQSNATVRCLQMHPEDNQVIIGSGSDEIDLMFSTCDRKYLVPHASEEEYKHALLHLIELERPDMIHFQHDLEVWKATEFRSEIEELGVRMLVPERQVIEDCVFKTRTWNRFVDAGIKVPANIILENDRDLHRAMKELADKDGQVWFRSGGIGNGGKGSLSTNEINQAQQWITKNRGWGTFLAAEKLPGPTVTWLSIWVEGHLVVGQGRLRHSWAYSSLAPSGVTGITRVCETVSDRLVDEIAIASIKAVSDSPNGIFGVDMMYDEDGIPNPTEINISRFFTTIEFFAQAGLNMPSMLRDIVLHDSLPDISTRINPVQPGLLWLRTLDERPILTSRDEMRSRIKRVNTEKLSEEFGSA